jgi:DNA-binding GntR family transcriptional regulator
MTPLDVDAPLGRTLREQVLVRLRQAIVTGELAPGEPLKQDQLAEWLGVSSTPVREAIADLAREQLVDLEPNRGARVRPLTRETSLEFARTYRLLFEAAYEWGLPNLTDTDHRKITALTDELRQCCSGGDYGPAFDIDAAIHRTVFVAAGNTDLQALLASMKSRAHRLLNLRMPQTIWNRNPDLYDTLFAAARKGDYAAARTMLSRAWDGWLDMVGAAMPEEAAEPA